MFSRDGADPRFWQGFDHAKLDDMPLDLRKAYLATAPHPEQLPSFFAKSVQRMREFKGWTQAQLQSIRRPAVNDAAPRPGQSSGSEGRGAVRRTRGAVWHAPAQGLSPRP
jgi:hypothetical protein